MMFVKRFSGAWAMSVMLVIAGVVVLSMAGCSGPPAALKQPLPATEKDARAEIETLLKFSCVGTADPVAGVVWLTWREQVHKPELTWVKRRIRLDWPVEFGFHSAGRLGWRVDVALVGSAGIDPNLTIPADSRDGSESGTGESGSGNAALVETLTKTSFIVPTAAEAGRLRSAWLRITGGPVVPNLE